MTLQIAVLVSGRGSNLEAFMRHIRTGSLDAEIRLVLSNNPHAPAIRKAAEQGIATWTADHRAYSSREAFDQDMQAAIHESGADTIALAGYMRMLSPAFIQAFAGRILNIHPALLPAFPGVHGARDAVDYGARISGCTVHFVDEIMDHGPVIIQAAVPLGCDDDESALHARIQELERRIYPQALQWLAEDRLRLEGRKVRLLPAARSSLEIAPEPGCLVSPPLEKF